MHQPFSSFRLAVAIAVPALALGSLPFQALAAQPTTQQILNEAVNSAASYAPLRTNIDATVKFDVKAKTANGHTGSGEVHATLMDRMFSDTTGEGQFTIDRFSAKGDPAVVPFTTISVPISLAWKSIGNNSYIQIAGLPTSITDIFKGMGIDATPVLGQWILLTDQSGSVQSSAASLMPVIEQVNTAPAMFLKLVKSVEKVPFFRVIRVEKRTVQTDGKHIARVRVAVNQQFISAKKKLDVAAITSKGKARTVALTAINKQYAELQSQLAKIHFVAVIDETAHTLQRIEIGGKDTQNQTSCTKKTPTSRNVCKTDAVTTISYAVALTLNKDTGAAIAAPTDAVPLQQILEKLMPAAPPADATGEGTLPDATNTNPGTGRG